MPELDELLRDLPPLPNIWSEGAPFAYSGLDGWTEYGHYVCSTGVEPFDLLLHGSRRRLLRLRAPGAEASCLSGDVFAAATPGGALLASFSARHTLIGMLPEDGSVELKALDDVTVEGRADGALSISEDDAVILLIEDRRFALGMGADAEDALARAQAGLAIDPWKTARTRLESYRELPRIADAGRARLLSKCLSVMRVNAMAPEGSLAQRWSTPDRHAQPECRPRASAFHSLAMNHLDPQAAAEYLQSAFATQRDDGMIPRRARPDGWRSEGSEAPLLCWAAWTNHRFTEDAKDLRRALHHGARALDWDLSHFDGDADGLLEEHFCTPGDLGAPFDSLAFSVCAAEDMRHLALIAEELGEGDSAERWQLRARRMRESIHELLWDVERGIYVERGSNGDSAAPGALAGALPVLLPDLATERVERLAALVDGALRRDEPWRGVIDLDWLVVEGLRRHGRREQAAALGERLIALMQSGYEARGRIVPPAHRPQDPVTDEHPTAALCFLLLLDDC